MLSRSIEIPSRNRRLAISFLAFSSFITLLLCAAAARGAADATPDLGGTWKRAERFSEDPEAKRRAGATDGAVKRGGAGRGSGGGRGGGGRRGGSGPRAGGERGAPGGGRLPLRPGAQAIELIHSEPNLEIKYADGSTRTIFTSKKARREAGPRAHQAEVGKWKHGVFVVKSRSTKAKFKECFELSGDGTRLWLTTKLTPNSGLAVTFMQTYQRGVLLGIEKPSS